MRFFLYLKPLKLFVLHGRESGTGPRAATACVWLPAQVTGLHFLRAWLCRSHFSHLSPLLLSSDAKPEACEAPLDTRTLVLLLDDVASRATYAFCLLQLRQCSTTVSHPAAAVVAPPHPPCTGCWGSTATWRCWSLRVECGLLWHSDHHQHIVVVQVLDEMHKR